MKAQHFIWPMALGLGLVIALLALLARHAPPAQASPHIYYVREGAAGDCLSTASPCGHVQRAIDLAFTDGDEVHIAAGVYTENLIITHAVKLRGGWDVSFTYQSPDTTPTVPTVIDGDSLTFSVHISAMPLTVVSIQGLTLRHSDTGIKVSQGNVTVERCIVRDASEQGLRVDDGTVLISATQILTVHQGIEVIKGRMLATGVHVAHVDESGLLIRRHSTVTFTHSTISSCAGSGVWTIGGTLWLLDNSIYNTAQHGIYAQDYHDVLVLSGNVVHNTTGDGIHIENGATVAIWGNAVYAVNGNGIDAQAAVLTITHNSVSNCSGTGILVNGTQDIHVEGNVVLNNSAGIAIYRSSGLTLSAVPVFAVINNMVGGNTTVSIGLIGRSTGVVHHNTLVGPGWASTPIADSGKQATGIAAYGPLTATVVNNIAVGHSLGITTSMGATLHISHTLLWDNVSDPITGTTALLAPPGFVAPAQQNYHLLAGSPAVDAGIHAGILADIDGDPRPAGLHADIGADEFREFPAYLPDILRAYPPPPTPPPPLPYYHLYAESGDLEWLAQDPYRDETIPATFCSNTQAEGNRERCWGVDIRYRGDTARLMPKKSWKIYFAASDPFQHHEGSIYELNLNADYVDQSLLRSYLAYNLFARADVPGPRVYYAGLYINDIYYGLFSQVEQIDERFLYRDAIDLHGNLYKPFYGDLGTLDHIEDPAERAWWYRYHYPKKTNRLSGIEDMIAFIELINYTSDVEFPHMIARALDVNEWLDWYAINVLIGNLEMMSKNFYLYHDLSTSWWMILPWDVDISLGHNEGKTYGLFDRDISWDNPIDSGADPTMKHNFLIERMMNVPEFRYHHCRLLAELMAGAFSPTQMSPRIDAAFSYIYDATLADPNRWRPELEGYPGFEDGPDEIKTYVANRIHFLQGEMTTFCPGLSPPLVVNELMARNNATIIDNAGDFDPWIEIHNVSDNLAWDLSGMHLVDGSEEATSWRFPDDTIIPAGDTLLVWVDGEASEGPLHATFTLDPAGGLIGLLDRDVFNNAVISVLTYTEQITDVSQGRIPDGNASSWETLTVPTPGWLNQGHPPHISDTAHTPSWPTAGTAVTVTTAITDETTVEATLWYRTSPPGGQPSAYRPTPLIANANRYTGTIPPQADGTWVEYYIEAADENGMASIDRPAWPQRDYRYIVGWQRPPLYINELMAINTHTIQDEAGRYDDWIEIYNAGPVDLDASGMFLSNNVGSATQFTLPTGTTVPARGYLVLWADGSDGEGHLDFRLSGAGEYLGLFDSADRFFAPVDATYFNPQMPDVSWGRFPLPAPAPGQDIGSQWHSMSISTPGAPNRLHPPQFSQVTRTPTWPNADDSVAITIVITAGFPTVSVALWYDIGDGFQTLPVTATESQSETNWQFALPPQPEGRLVRYYLEAEDSRGQITQHPAAAPSATHRYMVGYTPPTVFVNEFLADNSNANHDSAGEYDDWVELYNAGAVTVTLERMYLTDDLAEPERWPFPSGASIPPGGHVLIWCDRDIGQGPLHTNFRLDQDGEEIGLLDSDANGNVPLDIVVFGLQRQDISYGRHPDGSETWSYFDLPTPGTSNE